MKQCIVNLPENATITAYSYDLHIENHRVVDSWNLFWWIQTVITNDGLSDVIPQLEEQNIGFEAVIEECVEAMDKDDRQLVNLISWYYDLYMRTEIEEGHILDGFAASAAGIKIREQFKDKIRDCSNWDDLRRSFNDESMFVIDMKKQIKTEWKKWYKKQ